MKTSDAQRAYAARRRASPEHQERQKMYMAEWKAKNKDKKIESDRTRYKQNARKIVLRRHGVSEEWYERKLAEQDGLCAICRGPPDGRWKRFAVDHDHHTGIPRGLLCSLCNRGLGFFKDNQELLASAARYLKESKQ